ncbi:hypothetical protein XENTR_v10022097 [Xenopus tropicalis]|nr:hypothetical protein XENTR_v10022097 [Xenopus tropicalis]
MLSLPRKLQTTLKNESLPMSFLQQFIASGKALWRDLPCSLDLTAGDKSPVVPFPLYQNGGRYNGGTT